MIIAVSGKGGAGKTLVSSLIIKSLMNEDLDILAIDADPDSNLPEALGIEVDHTVGDVREELKKDTAEGNIPPDANKWDILDYKIMESLIETPEFDLMVMGRPEGSGCYCAVNNILRKIIERLSSNYDIIVIDTEAGLEHLSRRTTQNVDVMLMVTDPSKRGILTAKRIEELSKDLDISFENSYLILNRVKPGSEDELLKEVSGIGMGVAGTIYEDQEIESYDRKGTPLIDLPRDSQAFESISHIISNIQKNLKKT